MDLKKYIAEVMDFPIEGISFKDVTTIMEDGAAFRYAVSELSGIARGKGADVIVGPEARGFLFGTPVAIELGVGFVPVRKPGKLPREVVSASYDLEYGQDTLCIHKDSIKPGMKVMIVDDLLATGGTVKATIDLIEGLGGEVVGCAFLIDLPELGGRDVLAGYDVTAMVSY